MVSEVPIQVSEELLNGNKIKHETARGKYTGSGGLTLRPI